RADAIAIAHKRAANNDPIERFLWRCAARTLTPEAEAELRALAAALREEEWAWLFGRALSHKMAPLVYYHLARVGALAQVPRATAEDFGQQYRQTLISNRRAQAELLRIFAGFEAVGVAAMPLKGLALAYRYYEHFALRPMSDLDLLVRRDDITRAT